MKPHDRLNQMRGQPGALDPSAPRTRRMKSILLIYPPVSKPCEPPAGIAKLAHALGAHGVDCRVYDASLDCLLGLLHRPMSAGDTWTRRALVTGRTPIWMPCTPPICTATGTATNGRSWTSTDSCTWPASPDGVAASPLPILDPTSAFAGAQCRSDPGRRTI